MCPKSRRVARTDIRGKFTGILGCKEGPCKEMDQMRLKFAAIATLIAAAAPASIQAAIPTYTIEQAVAVAEAHNPEIAIARKKVQGARGGFVEARSGFLPSLTSSGQYDKRQQQSETRLRSEDYNATLRLEQNLYTGGAVTSQVAIARLNIEKQNYELQETAGRVAMDVRIAFNELLLNRAKVRVREDSVRVLDEELKSQQQSFSAGIVGKLNVQRAEVALANEQPELFKAQTQLKNSYLRLGDLFGGDDRPGAEAAPFEVSGELQYQPNHTELNDCLRSTFLDLQQSERVLEKETSNVQAADEALEIAKSNFAAGLGTQLDILQAASDVTRTRTTRLSAIYLHNVALARLAHACASSAEALNFGSKMKNAKNDARNAAQAADLARPPAKLSQR